MQYISDRFITPGFPHFYDMLGANLGLLLYGEVSVMRNKKPFDESYDDPPSFL